MDIVINYGKTRRSSGRNIRVLLAAIPNFQLEKKGDSK